MPLLKQRVLTTLATAALAVAVAWLATDWTTSLDRDVHALYARALAGQSRTQAVLLVAYDEETRAAWGPPPWSDAKEQALAEIIEAGAPRLVIWPERQLDMDGSGATTEGDPGYLVLDVDSADAAPDQWMGVDPLLGPTVVRAQNPGFPAEVLQALGLPARREPLPTRFVAHLPTVSAHRVADGEIPPGTFRDRVVVVGRDEPATATVATPLGPMSPAQVEAHALLGALDGEVWTRPPAGPRRVASGLWALGLAALLRRRGPGATAAIVLAATAAALALDAALFAGGLVLVGALPALVIAASVAVASQLLALGERVLARERPDGHGARATASTASGLHKVSGA